MAAMFTPAFHPSCEKQGGEVSSCCALLWLLQRTDRSIFNMVTEERSFEVLPSKAAQTQVLPSSTHRGMTARSSEAEPPQERRQLQHQVCVSFILSTSSVSMSRVL